MVEFSCETEKQIFSYFKKIKDWTTVQLISQELKLSWATAGKYVLVLEAKGLLESKEFGKFKTYRIKGEGHGKKRKD